MKKVLTAFLESWDRLENAGKAMSRSAVSGEYLAMTAHLLLVSLPSKPSSSRLSSFTWRSFMGVAAQVLPEARLGQDGIQRVLRLIDGAMERVEEPGEPLGDVHRSLLGPLQDVVVGLALPLDLRRQTIEALWAAVGTCQQQVADGPSDTSVAIVERVQGDEPEMPEAGLEQRRFA